MVKWFTLEELAEFLSAFAVFLFGVFLLALGGGAAWLVGGGLG